ncbi:NUDIX domain-containing protein [Plantibacter sp. RU18]|uniref:NUDIX domain-containing protein n=1 Tax=Plantibacter sp. RU18 TaxID=3158143 RepID=UPI003D360AAB
MGYVGSDLWQLRQLVGHRMLALPRAQILVLDGERALFQRRVDSGLWEIPAGSCEPESTFRSTAVAELREETSLIVRESDLEPFASLSDPGVHTLEYPNGDRVHAFAMCFVVRRWSGELRAEDEEVVEFVWSPLDRPPSPTHRPTVEVIRLFRAFQKAGAFQAA